MPISDRSGLPGHNAAPVAESGATRGQPLGRLAGSQLTVDDRLNRPQSLEISHVSCDPRVEHRLAPKSLSDFGKPEPQALKRDICI